MKTLGTVLLGFVICSSSLSSMGAPAFALEGCGVDGHRGARGQCVWGGQREWWCVRHTGRRAVYTPDGLWVCPR